MTGLDEFRFHNFFSNHDEIDERLGEIERRYNRSIHPPTKAIISIDKGTQGRLTFLPRLWLDHVYDENWLQYDKTRCSKYSLTKRQQQRLLCIPFVRHDLETRAKRQDIDIKDIDSNFGKALQKK